MSEFTYPGAQRHPRAGRGEVPAMHVGRRVAFRVLALLLCMGTAAADIGPKPSMSFRLKYQTSAPVQLLSGEQMQSFDPGFADARPLAAFGPQGFSARQDHCFSSAYGYAPYQKLVLKYSDRVRESNIFSSVPGDVTYDVLVTDTALIVGSPTLGERQMGQFLNALRVTLVVELLVAIVFVAVCRLPWVVLLGALLANVLSLSFIWLVLPRLGLASTPGFASMELLVVAFEAALIFALHRPKLSLRRALLLATLMNVASVVAGLFLGI